MVKEKLRGTLRNLILAYSNRFLNKWIILLYDVFVVGLMFLLAYFIRHNFIYHEINPNHVEVQAFWIVLTYGLFFMIGRSFTGIIRHTSWNDAYRIVRAAALAFGVVVLASIFLHQTRSIPSLVIPYSIVVLHFLLSVFALISSRLLIKGIFYKYIQQGEGKKLPVLIYGAGSAGMLTRDALLKDIHIPYSVVAFIDDNPTKNKKRLNDTPIVPPDIALDPSYIEKHEVKQLIIAIKNMSLPYKQEIIERALRLNLQVKSVPSIEHWINGELNTKQVKRVMIEDLLEREPIRLDNQNIQQYLLGKRVLITGAAGSIGSEIARQVLRYQPQQVLVLDQAESAVYDLQFEINHTKSFGSSRHLVEYVIADVKDQFRMDQIFEKYRPEIIFHAAAYKHVPLMEQHPYEAIKVNVFGTKTVVDLAIKHKVKKFIMISTDKAVNPTNIMGASKRIAEIYTQSRQNGSTQFITTRFGNVMGSNGSVIPLFRRQIEQGGPITVTHKDIIRYFMTIPEACNLVLEAGAMGKGGEIFVFDMGQPVKIYEMAKKMVQLSGLNLGVDINIVETGLRPGEKLYEELLSDKETTKATHHPKIMIADIRPEKRGAADQLIYDLSEAIVEHEEFKLVSTMKRYVPEFVSNNSIYSQLDSIKVKSEK